MYLMPIYPQIIQIIQKGIHCQKEKNDKVDTHQKL